MTARGTLIRLIALSLLALALAGCGRKGLPQPPPGVPHVYPRVYPNA
jgi:predicted small lipoprotein YifL